MPFALCSERPSAAPEGRLVIANGPSAALAPAQQAAQSEGWVGVSEHSRYLPGSTVPRSDEHLAATGPLAATLRRRQARRAAKKAARGGSNVLLTFTKLRSGPEAEADGELGGNNMDGGSGSDSGASVSGSSNDECVNSSTLTAGKEYKLKQFKPEGEGLTSEPYASYDEAAEWAKDTATKEGKKLGVVNKYKDENGETKYQGVVADEGKNCKQEEEGGVEYGEGFATTITYASDDAELVVEGGSNLSTTHNVLVAPHLTDLVALSLAHSGTCPHEKADRLAQNLAEYAGLLARAPEGGKPQRGDVTLTLGQVAAAQKSAAAALGRAPHPAALAKVNAAFEGVTKEFFGTSASRPSTVRLAPHKRSAYDAVVPSVAAAQKLFA